MDAINYRTIGSRAYVPVVTVLAVLLIGNWLTRHQSFDLLAIAQNPRVRFKRGNEVVATAINGLNPAEVRMAAAVVDHPFGPFNNPNELVYFGDSQSLAIMDATSSDLTTPQWIQILLMRAANGESKPPRVVLGALPNLSMCELVVRLVDASLWQPYPVRVVIASLPLHEWRHMAVRDEVLREANTPAVRNAIARLEAANPDLTMGITALSGSLRANSQTAPSRAHLSLADRLEQWCQREADRIPLFHARAWLFARLNVTYDVWRNRLLDIRPDSPRPVPPATYQASLQLLEVAIRYARARGIKLIFVLAPIRPIKPNPMLPADIARYRRDVIGLCEKYGVECLDYVDLVPERLWTNYMVDNPNVGQRDYAHFTGAAHRLLAQRLWQDAGAKISAWLQ